MMKTERMGMLAVALILLVVVAVAIVRSCPAHHPEPLAPNQELVESAKADSAKSLETKPDTAVHEKRQRRHREAEPPKPQRPPRDYLNELIPPIDSAKH